MQLFWPKIWKPPTPYWKDTPKLIWPKTRPSCFVLVFMHACLCSAHWLHHFCTRAGCWNRRCSLTGLEGRLPYTQKLSKQSRSGGEALCDCGSVTVEKPTPDICSSWLPPRLISIVRGQFCSCSAWQSCTHSQPNSIGPVHGQWHSCTLTQMITLL